MVKGYLCLICLILAGLGWSCKKKDIEIPKEFPVELIAERWEVRTGTRLFSNNQEITDASVIKAFEEKTNLLTWIENSPDLEDEGGGVKFESELTASFYPPSDDRLFDVERKGTRFLFYSRDMYGVNPSDQPSADSFGFLHTMLKYADRLGEPDPITGIRQTREVRVAHGNYKVLKVSAFAYALRCYSQSGLGAITETSARDGVIINEFDADVSKFLGPTDTLAVKEYSIICALPK